MISARTARIDDNFGRGTDGSNPLPSSGESFPWRQIGVRRRSTQREFASASYNRTVEDPDGYLWEIIWMTRVTADRSSSVSAARPCRLITAKTGRLPRQQSAGDHRRDPECGGGAACRRGSVYRK